MSGQRSLLARDPRGQEAYLRPSEDRPTLTWTAPGRAGDILQETSLRDGDSVFTSRTSSPMKAYMGHSEDMQVRTSAEEEEPEEEESPHTSESGGTHWRAGRSSGVHAHLAGETPQRAGEPLS